MGPRQRVVLILAGLAMVVAVSARLAYALGLSFLTVQPGFTQDLYATSAAGLGGVAFAPNGDPWVDECAYAGSPLHRFAAQQTFAQDGSTLHPEAVLASAAGCGLANHPDGTLYSNTSLGVANLDANGAALLRRVGAPGNALGIAMDPQTNHLVYVAADCRFTATCTLVDLDPVAATSAPFATLTAADAQLVDGIAFDPAGNYLFLANRGPRFRLTILTRSGALVRHVPLASEPDGLALHAGPPPFVLTSNTDGTMTRFDFTGGDYSQPPTVSAFASGGFRGDLAGGGPDGCLYVTQAGARYDDGAVAAASSLVQVCGGFGGGPGVLTFTPTGTATATATPTASPTPSETATVSPTASDTPTETETPSPTPTATPSDTSTPAPTETSTPTETPTITPTATPTATGTATGTPTPTATPSATATPTSTPTGVPTATATAIPTPTPSPIATTTPSATATPTQTVTPTVTRTASPTASATPTPTPTAQPGQACVLCVLSPGAASALTASGNGLVSVPGGAIAVDSAASQALTASGNVVLSATRIGVVGGYSKSGNASFSPGPVAITPVADPFLGLPVPAFGPMNPSISVSGNGTATASPGTYASLSASGNGVLTLQPGTYVITQGVSISSNSGTAKLIGNGATLYLTCGTASQAQACASGQKGASLSISGTATYQVSAPTSGPYAGVAVFADRKSTATISLSGNGSDSWTGAIYAAGGALALSGNGGTTQLNAVLAVGTASLSGNGNITLTFVPGPHASLSQGAAASAPSDDLPSPPPPEQAPSPVEQPPGPPADAPGGDVAPTLATDVVYLRAVSLAPPGMP